MKNECMNIPHLTIAIAKHDCDDNETKVNFFFC